MPKDGKYLIKYHYQLAQCRRYEDEDLLRFPVVDALALQLVLKIAPLQTRLPKVELVSMDVYRSSQAQRHDPVPQDAAPPKPLQRL